MTEHKIKPGGFCHPEETFELDFDDNFFKKIEVCDKIIYKLSPILWRTEKGKYEVGSNYIKNCIEDVSWKLFNEGVYIPIGAVIVAMYHRGFPPNAKFSSNGVWTFRRHIDGVFVDFASLSIHPYNNRNPRYKTLLEYLESVI